MGWSPGPSERCERLGGELTTGVNEGEEGGGIVLVLDDCFELLCIHGPSLVSYGGGERGSFFFFSFFFFLWKCFVVYLGKYSGMESKLAKKIRARRGRNKIDEESMREREGGMKDGCGLGCLERLAHTFFF